MNNIFENAPGISEELEPRFTLRECLWQVFWYEFVGNELSHGAYINYHEDGFYDASLRIYLPIISKGLLRHCRFKGITLSDEQKTYIQDISMHEPLPEEWNTVREIRWALIELYRVLQPNGWNNPESMIQFFEDMENIGNADGLDIMNEVPLESSVLNDLLMSAFAQSENPHVREKAMRIIASWKKVW